MTKYRKSFVVLLLLIAAAPLCAQDSTRGKGLNDPLLEKLVGDWNVERKFGNGRAVKNMVHGEWVLKHQFVELHYHDTATPSAYEAIALIGYDDIGKRYICHWADNFGGAYSNDGFAPRDEGTNALDFKFESHDGQLENRFAFDSQSGTWTSTIRQTEKGEWKLFCRDKFVRTLQSDARQ
jgi:Protein of unknown function (DUF1579)